MLFFTLLHLVLMASRALGTENIRSSKKGVVVPHWPSVKCGDLDAFKTIGWWYNYHTFPEIYESKPNWCTCEDGKPPQDHSVCFPSDPEVVFVPLVHGIKGFGNRPEEDDPPVREEFDIVLGYNEPNQPDQSNIPPEEAALAWIELQALYPNKTLVSPSCSGANTVWMDEFMNICEDLGCRIDYIATHIYPKGTVTSAMNTLKNYSERYGKKIWLTEFARRNTHNASEVIEFIEEFLPQLEAADYIWRYSWFLTRYYDNPVDDSGNFWIDGRINTLLDFSEPKLTATGSAYDKPWHQ